MYTVDLRQQHVLGQTKKYTHGGPLEDGLPCKGTTERRAVQKLEMLEDAIR